MESASIAGAENIAKISLEERTKRAMLAEAVEGMFKCLLSECGNKTQRSIIKRIAV